MILQFHYKDPSSLLSAIEDSEDPDMDVNHSCLKNAPGEDITLLYDTEKRVVVDVLCGWTGDSLMMPAVPVKE